MADRLAVAWRKRFFGRVAEVELFRSTIAVDEPPFVVLYLYGPGGVGKTTLLHEYARLAEEAGRPVVLLDGHNINLSPQGFLQALSLAMGLDEGQSPLEVFGRPSGRVLLLDTYEMLAPLEGWLRETFLPQLPAHTLVVIAGRNPPASAWRTDIAWADLTRIVSLRNLRPEESQAYLTAQGVSLDQHSDVLAFTHGHPLALSLVADVLSQRDKPVAFNPQHEPDVVRVLLERFVQDVPGADHRLALEVCVLAWATSEALLTEVLDKEAVRDCLDWLRQLSFIEQGPYGLFPHDVAREVLDADLRWRNPDSYRQLRPRLSAHLRSRLLQANGLEQQRLQLEWLYLRRHVPFIKPFFDWNAMDVAYAEPASPEDRPAIVAMVRAHEGDASAQIAEHWLRRQPQAFLAFRNVEGKLTGFMASITLHQATPDDLAADPAAPAALNFAQRHGPTRPGEEMVHLRFWMGRDTYQTVSSAINLAATNSVTYWITHPKLAWNFIAMANPEFWRPHFAGINMQRSLEADFEVGGRHYGVFTHDWRVESASVWPLGQRVQTTLSTPERGKPLLPLLVLSQPEFEEAVRQALRNYARPDLLAENPLMRSRVVLEAAGAVASPAALQTLLREAAAALTTNPKDEKLYRAVWRTYVEPAPTQERAAEMLALPFSTYRYHLTKGVERITAWLWQRELHGAER